MSEVLKVDDYIKDVEEVGLPKLQEAFGRILKCEPIPLKLTIEVDYRKDTYIGICSGDLKFLLGDTLVHTLFLEITLKGWSSEPFREDISNDNPEGEIFLPFRFGLSYNQGKIFLPFRFGLSYNHPNGGSNGVEFRPQWIYWSVSDKEWLYDSYQGSERVFSIL